MRAFPVVCMKENLEKGSGAMSDAPVTRQDDAEDIFISNLIYESKKTAKKEQKTKQRKQPDPGGYTVFARRATCVEHFVI